MVQQLWFLPGNAQHIAMYSAFIFSGIFDILKYKKVDIPPKSDWAMGCIAFFVEAYIFSFHLMGKDPLDVNLHVLLVYAIIGCFFFSVFEMIFPHQVLLTYGRILCILLQATWFIETAFVVYPEVWAGKDYEWWVWDPYDHGHMMLITMSYVYHVLFIIAFLVVELWLVKKYYLKRYGSSRFDELMTLDDVCYHETFANGTSETTKFLRLHSDDESGDEKIAFDSLKLNIKQKNSASSSGNSSGNSRGSNTSPV